MPKDHEMQVIPGRGVGFLTLGAALYDILTRCKSQPQVYPIVEITYDPSEPLLAPVLLHLPSNGIRLRFDGPDQRLRLIEVLDFTKTRLSYDGKDFVKTTSENTTGLGGEHNAQGPSFRHVYDRLIGLAFPGEYVPPKEGAENGMGTYVLSYPGIAFTFPLQHSAWSPKSFNFNTVLSTSAAGPASSMAVFNGASWQEASQDLYTRPCANPRSLGLHGRAREQQPDEIEVARIRGSGTIEIIRRASPPFRITLGTTTPQDLVAELGPPDQIKYGKSDVNLDIYKGISPDSVAGQGYYGSSTTILEGVTDSEHTSGHTTADESDSEGLKNAANSDGPVECFYNYFRHGLDIFVSAPTKPLQSSNQLVATKMLLHGNVPGSFQFRRYRRSRWVIELEGADDHLPMHSETPFKELADNFEQIFHDPSRDESPYRRWWPINRNRGWNSPGSSCELAGGWEEQADGRRNVNEGSPGDGNAKMFGYPGLVFEVLKNDTVASLMIY